MGSGTAQKGESPKSVNYAVARSRKREATRKRIHQHVLHPIDTPSLTRDPLYHPTSPIDSTIGTARVTGSSLIIVVRCLSGIKGSLRRATPLARTSVRFRRACGELSRHSPRSGRGSDPRAYAALLRSSHVRIARFVSAGFSSMIQ